VTPWLVVHVGTLLFVPLMAAVIYLLTRGVDGRAASVSRIALVPFLLFYLAFEVLVGIGLGLFVDQSEGLPATEQAAAAKVVEEFPDAGLLLAFEWIGTGSLIVALIAAGIALYRHEHVSVAVPILLALSAIPVSWHVPPFGQFGLALFLVAVVLVLRARSATSPAAPRVQPAPA
jgi:hypothetical protein